MLQFFTHEEGRLVPDGSIAEYRYEFTLTDHLGNARVTFSDMDDDGAIQTATEVLQTDHYYPFGMRMSLENATSITTNPPNKYLYNGKELQTDLDLNWYDYGARMYDASIARWNGVDIKAENRIWLTPYNYVQNSPLIRVDPNGETDFKLNKDTGEFTQVGKPNDEPDRVLKTDKNGNIKRKGDGPLGFLVRKSERGKAKVAIDKIEKGILSDGVNFKNTDVTKGGDNVIKVNGDGQPSLTGVEDFLTKLSNHIRLEIAAAYLSEEDGADAHISHVYVDGYADNTIQKSFTSFDFGSKGVLHLNRITSVHTHLSNIGLTNDVYRPNLNDLEKKELQSAHFINFLIISRSQNDSNSSPLNVERIPY